MLVPLTTPRPVVRIFVEGYEHGRKKLVIEDLKRRGYTQHAAVIIYRSRLEDEVTIIRSTVGQVDMVVLCSEVILDSSESETGLKQ